MEKNNLQHAREEGEQKKAIEVAKKMLSKQKPIEEIMEMTELTREQIEQLKESFTSF